jgi:hypothetical protein
MTVALRHWALDASALNPNSRSLGCFATVGRYAYAFRLSKNNRLC